MTRHSRPPALLRRPGIDEEDLDGTGGITELEKFEPERVDGVSQPANGFPVLLMKGLGNSGTAAEEDTVEDDLAKDGAQSDDDSPDTGAPGEDVDGSGDSHEDDDDTKASKETAADDTAPAVAELAEPTAEAVKAAAADYETARRDYLAGEPGLKGADSATELLKARAEWNHWNSLGKDEGLDGTEEGRKRWIVKHLADEPPMEAPAVTEDAAEAEPEAELTKELLDAEEAVYKRTFTADERRKAAADHHALPDGCVAAETMVATRQGPQRIDSLVGERELLTDVGWAQAEIRSFGVKPLLAVTLRRGNVRQTVHATAGHRWLTDDGEWKLSDALRPGDRIPHVEVHGEGVYSHHLNAAERSVAVDAEQAADDAGLMVMVDLERRPHSASSGVSTTRLRHAFADGAATALLCDERVEVGVGDAVLPQQRSIATPHPAFVSELDAFIADPGAFLHAEAAVGTAVLARGTDVEVGVRPLDTASTAGNQSFVLDGNPVALRRRTGSGRWLSKTTPAAGATHAPSLSGTSALGWLAAVGAWRKRHASNLTRSRTWTVESVEASSRMEEVFCAVIPDLHRFVLANGILTGNSYPIENKEDLGNAATLARSGHGNVGEAKALIRRRAEELKVPNPLDDGNGGPGDSKKEAAANGTVGDSKDSTFKPGMKKCGTCKGEGKIKGGNMTCPDCKGKGAMKPKAAAKKAVRATVEAAVAAGMLTEQAAKEILDQVDEITTKASRPLPSSTEPVGAHREPDGTSTVERLEPEAGLGTDPDKTADKVPASVAALTMKDAPYVVKRAHDAFCAAYAEKAVLEEYPALSGVGDVAAAAGNWFAGLAAKAAETGDTADAADLAALVKAAEAVTSFDTAAVADGRALLHKSFTAMYPTEHISPKDMAKPGSFQRPYLSSSHAAESAGDWTVNIPKPAATPKAEDYQRGALTAGHAAPSPGDHGPNNSAGSGHRMVTMSQKDMAMAAMRAMHDHIAAGFEGMCPMSPSVSVMPPGMGATNAPGTMAPPFQGGLNVGKESGLPEDTADRMEALASQKVAGGGKRKKDYIAELEAALAAKSAADPAVIQNMVAEQIDALTGPLNDQIATLRKELDELGKQPDPAMAPVRGQMARRPAGDPPAPVEKRSLIEEARDRQVSKAADEQANYLAYLRMQAENHDPKIRERAEALLTKEESARVPA